MPPFLTEICEIVEGSEFSDLWPDDGSETKKEFVKFCMQSGLLTPLADLNNQLAGFLISYRSFSEDGLDLKRPDSGGPFVVGPIIWIRRNLRGGRYLKTLLKKALTENNNLIGGEILSFERLKRPGVYHHLNFPKFMRRFKYGRLERIIDNTGADCHAIDERECHKCDRQYAGAGSA